MIRKILRIGKGVKVNQLRITSGHTFNCQLGDLISSSDHQNRQFSLCFWVSVNRTKFITSSAEEKIKRKVADARRRKRGRPRK